MFTVCPEVDARLSSTGFALNEISSTEVYASASGMTDGPSQNVGRSSIRCT
jgi:hypothetical protein